MEHYLPHQNVIEETSLLYQEPSLMMIIGFQCQTFHYDCNCIIIVAAALQKSWPLASGAAILSWLCEKKAIKLQREVSGPEMLCSAGQPSG